MQDHNLNIFVITRFGLGQNSENFYRQELPYLENLLTKSILKQKDYITKWIILVDVNIPILIKEKLINLASKDLLYIYSHNPFATGSVMPDISLVLKNFGIKDGDKVLTIRVDADDMLSSNYLSSVLKAIKEKNLIGNYEKISINAINGVYFFPIRNKLVRVEKKDYSIQALYSIFGKNFSSVHDYSHQKIGEIILRTGGYLCILKEKDLWIRSMRQHSVTRFGKKFGILEGRFDTLKNFIKIVFYKFFKNNTIYGERVKTFDLFNNFEISETIIPYFNNHEKNLKENKVVISPMVQQIIKKNNIKSKFNVKTILLELYKNEKDENNKNNIKQEFYSL